MINSRKSAIIIAVALACSISAVAQAALPFPLEKGYDVYAAVKDGQLVAWLAIDRESVSSGISAGDKLLVDLTVLPKGSKEVPGKLSAVFERESPGSKFLIRFGLYVRRATNPSTIEEIAGEFKRPIYLCVLLRQGPEDKSDPAQIAADLKLYFPDPDKAWKTIPLLASQSIMTKDTMRALGIAMKGEFGNYVVIRLDAWPKGDPYTNLPGG